MMYLPKSLLNCTLLKPAHVLNKWSLQFNDALLYCNSVNRHKHV